MGTDIYACAGWGALDHTVVSTMSTRSGENFLFRRINERPTEDEMDDFKCYLNRLKLFSDESCGWWVFLEGS